MSLWYRTGTINLTNGTSALTGVGTAWVANVSPGMMVVYDRQIIGEVQSVNSDTSITLATSYAGTTISGGAYAIANLGAVRDGLIAAVNDALAAFQAEQDGPLSGRFGDGTLAEPGLAFLADINTGFRRPAADQIGMVTGGVQRALLSSAALQVDVPVTGTAVQSSATDTTAGRLMKVGAFGLGIADSIPAPASIDALTATGFYRYATGVTGAPSAAGVVLHMARLSSSGTSGFMQVAFGVSSQIFVRHLTDTVGPVWSVWTEITTRANLIGTVSQSGGVPTGAVIERGSNANGDYVRFADGTQICWHTLTVSLAINVAYLGGFRSGGQNWTFPAEFLSGSAPKLVALPHAATAFGATSHGTPSHLSGPWAVTAVTTQATANRTVDLIATGRWF